MNFASGIVEDFYVKNSENTNPGIVISKIRFDSQIYERALQEDISVASIEAFLEKRAAYKNKNRPWNNRCHSITWLE